MNVLDFRKMKMEARKISMVTCYDAWSAKIIEKSEIDCVLVGDSVSMVVHGHPSTVHATVEMMALHTQAVARGLSSKFLIGDMPFLSYRKGIAPAMEAAEALMRAGAHAVKLEGVRGHEDVVEQIVKSGIPVMGHVGLTPQSVHQLGGFRVQGRDEETAREIAEQARVLESLGCFAVVLECVPARLADEITRELRIPTIGIGAGVGTDGQVLVLQDLMGLNGEFKPKFVKTYANGENAWLQALNQFHCEVGERSFPGEKETYL